MKPLRLVACQELLLAVRSRWTQIFAVVFAGLALAVAASGYVLSGGHGVQDFARTAVSLVHLVLLLVPLTSLLIGVLSMAPERAQPSCSSRSRCRAGRSCSASCWGCSRRWWPPRPSVSAQQVW